MKKTVLIAICGFLSAGVMAQAKKPATAAKPAAKTTAAKSATGAPAMKNQLDSFSYAIGVSMANFYKSQGIKNVNKQLILKALEDVQNGKPTMDEMQCNNAVMSYMQSIRSEKASGNKKAGEVFLAENKKKPGVVTLPSGLQYTVLQEGTGPKPTIDDEVKVHYQGTLLDGTIFDSSIQRGEPIVLGLKNVIRGWTEALQLMPTGSKWRLFIPSDLAYGDNQAGETIKPGSTLIFDVELLEIVKK
ncbi:MAG: FKBP-type peptidyl-prolyl cis-trans isomerase [Chitinophagaceae bacterium]